MIILRLSQADVVRQVMEEYGFSRPAAEELVARSMQKAVKQSSAKILADKRGRKPYLQFLNEVSPHMDWDTAMAKFLAKVVDQVISGAVINVAISLPPRSGKSEQITKRLPVHWLESRPTDKVVVSAYNHTLAKMFTAEAMKMYKERNPDNMEGQAEDDWGNIEGGTVRAVGVGSGITGHGADCLLHGTRINTDVGIVNIEDLVAMDNPPMVMCWDHDKGELAYGKVSASRTLSSSNLYTVYTRNHSFLRATGDHRVYTPNGYRAVESLINGAMIKTYADWDNVVDIWKIKGEHTVYDIQVEKYKNFFASNLLVHNCLILDDAVKSHREAFSAAYRAMVWNWYLNDLRSRRNNLAKAPQIVIGTRWHTDDLIGRILANAEPGEWLEIRIPAIAGENDPLGRQPGESINPDRLPIKELMREKRLLGRRFDALFQQNPIDESGAMFNTEKLVEVDAVPIMAHRCRFWDRAASEGTGDFTVGVLMAYDDNGIAWVEDVIRGQWASDEVRRKMRKTLEEDTKKYGNLGRYKLTTCFEREPGGDGKTAAADIVRMMAPFVIYAEQPSDNKTARVSGFAIQVNAGNVRMKVAEWNDEYVNELSRFVADVDNGQDDQADASGACFNKLAIENAMVTIG